MTTKYQYTVLQYSPKAKQDRRVFREFYSSRAKAVKESERLAKQFPDSRFSVAAVAVS